MKDYTDITILLDRSGSMNRIKRDMEGGFDTFINEHKANPSSRVTLIQFDDKNDHDIVYQNVPVGNVERLNLVPRGNTPLLDAMVKAIDNTGTRLRSLDAQDRPERVLFIVITDGQENWSKHSTRTDVKSKLTHQADKYNWQFIYLGANQDTWNESQSLGFNWNNAIKWTPSAENINNVYRSLASSTVGYAAGVMPMAMPFGGDDRVKAATEDDRAKDSEPTLRDKLQAAAERLRQKQLDRK